MSSEFKGTGKKIQKDSRGKLFLGEFAKAEAYDVSLNEEGEIKLTPTMSELDKMLLRSVEQEKAGLLIPYDDKMKAEIEAIHQAPMRRKK